jgi:uncharacterized membrane protein YeiH
MIGWDLLFWLGTVAFAMSGAIAAMEEDYDLLGIWIVGLVTAFGGGMIRNVFVLDIPVALWDNHQFLLLATGAALLAYVLPQLWSRHLRMWIFLDAVGLAAFSIQGALIAESMDAPFAAVVAAALLSGCGGGVMRDVLSKRKPLLFREEVYAVWSIVGGLVVGLGFAHESWQLLILFMLLLGLRLLSVRYRWQLPKRKV